MTSTSDVPSISGEFPIISLPDNAAVGNISVDFITNIHETETGIRLI